MSFGAAPPLESGRSVGPTTDPTPLFDLAEGMHAIEALTAAVGWLHLFEQLETHPSDSTEICASLSLAPRPGRVLLTLLASLGLVQRDGRGVYHLTDLAREHMLPGSPWSLAPCFEALKDRPSCRSMLAVLRSGQPLGAPDPAASEQTEASTQPWLQGMDQEAFAEYFLNAIDSRNAYLAHVLAERLDLADRRSLLDVAGGSGIYACALVRRYPYLRATVLEKNPVDAVARRAVARRGLSDRVYVASGDMLGAPLPEGHDAHLYSNVIHDWDEATVRRLLAASFSALRPGGQIVLHDAFLDESQSGPRAVAEYSVLLMSFTAGRCYAVPEVRELIEAAGFRDVGLLRTAVHRSVVTASKPR
jgi:SAM-dependent methyltransferase